MTAPDTRPHRQMYDSGPEMTTTTDDYRQTWRQVGWLGQTGAFYALDEKPLQDGHERGGVAPLYFIAHADRREDTTPVPARGDAVEAWLKAQRDACFGHASTYNVVDGLLDEYRLHADTGTPLHEHVCEGGNIHDCAGCHDAAVRDA